MGVITTVHHDHIAGYVPDQHIAHSGVSISAGGILSGGGDITVNRTISLVQTDVDHDQITNTHNLTSDIDHGGISGLGDDDHTQYHNDSRAASWLTANHETTYNHPSYDTHLANNSQAHSDYLINNGNDSTSGRLTANGFTSSGGSALFFNTIISGLDSLLDVSAMTVTPAVQNIIKFDVCTLDVAEFAAFQPLYGGLHKLGSGAPGWLQLCGADATSSMIRIGVDADPYARLKITADGKIEWGIGVLVDDVIRDTNLYRSAANTLKTDDAFSADSLIIHGFTLTQADSTPAILTADDISINADSGILDLLAASEITLKPSEDTANFFKFNSNLTDLTLSTTHGSNLTITPAGGNTIITGRVGIGTITNPNAPLEVKGPKPGSIGGFQSGMLHVTGSGTAQFSNSVITGHNAFNTNTQLWYLGSMSSSNDDIAFINRQNAAMHFSTNNTSKMIIDASGNVGIGLTTVEANYKLIVRRAADVNFGIGLQSSELAIAAFNDAISANIPMRFYASEFNLLNGKVGMGVIDPDVKLEIFDAGTQLKLSYDAGNHTTFATGSDGDLTIATVDSDGAAGNINLVPDGVTTLGDGGTTNYSKFETNGTLEFNGAATVFEDIVIDLSAAKVPAANAPTWTSFISNLKNYTYDLNDFQEFSSEIAHSYKEGSLIHFHVHGVTNGLEGVDKTIKFQIEYEIINNQTADNFGGVFTGTAPLSAEIIILASTTDKTTWVIDVGDDASGAILQGATLKGRVIRIASSGTEPASDPFVTQVGVHIEKDTVGSRTELTK